MINITFAADNLFALRNQIVQFLNDAGFETVRETHRETPRPDPLIDRSRNANDTIVGNNRPFETTGYLQVAEEPQPAPLEPVPTASEPDPIPEETETEQQTDSASSVSLTFEDIRTSTLQLASLRGRDAVMAVIEPYGVKRASDVEPHLWPELMAKLEAAKNG